MYVSRLKNLESLLKDDFVDAVFPLRDFKLEIYKPSAEAPGQLYLRHYENKDSDPIDINLTEITPRGFRDIEDIEQNKGSMDVKITVFDGSDVSEVDFSQKKLDEEIKEKLQGIQNDLDEYLSHVVELGILERYEFLDSITQILTEDKIASIKKKVEQIENKDIALIKELHDVGYASNQLRYFIGKSSSSTKMWKVANFLLLGFPEFVSKFFIERSSIESIGWKLVSMGAEAVKGAYLADIDYLKEKEESDLAAALEPVQEFYSYLAFKAGNMSLRRKKLAENSRNSYSERGIKFNFPAGTVLEQNIIDKMFSSQP